MSNAGWLYCLSNACMPDIVKVGKCPISNPDIRSKKLFTTGVPVPFKVEFARYVTDVSKKEKLLHMLLENYHERTHKSREFFNVGPEIVKHLFELMDGNWWQLNIIVENDLSEDEDNQHEDNEDEDNEDEESDNDDSIHVENPLKVKGSRDMKKCFTDNQRIRHYYNMANKTAHATYNSSTNTIIYNNTHYPSLHAFGLAHVRETLPTRKNFEGWRECECEIDGKWISTYSLEEHS